MIYFAPHCARNAMLDATVISCPYCGESIEILLEPGAEDQRYIEDCQVCCRPIAIAVSVGEEGQPSVSASSENEV